MSRKLPMDFKDHADWIHYVRQSVPEQDQAYTLADGRTELFVAIYRTRGQTLPSEFEVDRGSIGVLTEPARAAAAEHLNERILADLTHQMFDQSAVTSADCDALFTATPRQRIDELIAHLVRRNAAFALARSLDDAADSATGESEFASAMANLNKLLSLFRDRNQPLPPLTFERAWFLHYLREPERMLQTRAVLNTLTAEIDGCMSA